MIWRNFMKFFFWQTNYQTVEAILKAIEDDLEIVHDPSLELFQTWLEKQSKVLSENHYLQLVLKKRLLDVYRLTPPPPEENLEEFRDFMEKQVNLGQNLLDIWSILEPGYSFKRGRILRQLHLPVLHLAKLDLKAKKISLPEFVLKTKQALKNMAEVTKCMENFDEVNHINGKNGKDFQALERDQAQSALGYLS